MAADPDSRPLRVLVVTNMYPTADMPRLGIFIQRQVEGLRALGVHVDLLIEDRAHRGMGIYLGTRRRIRDALASDTVDLVHCRYGGFLALATWFGRRNVPMVLSLCGSDLLGEPQLGGFRAFAASLGARVSRWLAPRVDHVIVMSPAMASALGDAAPPERVTVVPDGTDMELFRPMDQDECRSRLGWARNDDGHDVLFGGYRGAPRKRLDLAEQSVDEVRRLGLKVELHVPDGVPAEMMPVWINASDAMLLTSAHEGSPNIVRESLACDVPVVSVDVGDVRQRLEAVEGCRVTTDDPRELGAALFETLTAAKNRIDGRASVESASLPATAEQVLAVYHDVLARS
jgi:glycosyltransferase involved in cell wall biosynthesis